MKKYILALDQGTTSSRAILFDDNCEIAAVAQREIKQIYPNPGWVEHDPVEIWTSVKELSQEVLVKSGVPVDAVAGIGITNQRETTIVWNKETGAPVYNAIVWQCRRTSEIIDGLSTEQKLLIKERTGLVPDAYFSASKIKWILDHVSGARELAKEGKLLFGTVDCWLIWNLTGGKVHATDYTNASRTMLFDIKNLCWDREILDIFQIPENILPEVYPSGFLFGNTEPGIYGKKLPIAGAAGDQQASLFGHCGFEPGDAKNTYGTGCFLLMNTGKEALASENGLITTIAAGCSDQVNYVLEGSVFIGGAVVQWLRDELSLIATAAESEQIALDAVDTEGAYLVPAFAGLGAPYWKQDARGMMVGLTRGFNRNHFVRAALESIAYQCNDLVKAMEADAGIQIRSLLVDGGACANGFLMQFQSDITGTDIHRASMLENTALGAAYLAGLTVGIFVSEEELKKNRKTDRIFHPGLEKDKRELLIKGWKKAIRMALEWTKDE